MKFLETLVELVYWFLIFLSPTLILGFAGFVVYYNYKGDLGFIAFIGLSASGIILGVYFAERIRKTVGCAMFMTRTNWSNSEKNNNK